MGTDLATLERRQVERLEHMAQLRALIDRKQHEIDNLRAAENFSDGAAKVLRLVVQ